MNTRMHIIDYIGQVATTALLEEVSATPKPGLVDRANNGAHSDMDFFTFMNSSAALSPYFFQMAEIGYDWKDDLEALFSNLRIIGMEAEKAMFRATHNINTHKGSIFSLGILSGAAAYYYKKNKRFNIDDILLLCGEMTANILEKEFAHIKKTPARTKGEELYCTYGVKGIRGEVQGGFESIRNIALPVMKELAQQGNEKNDILVQTLFFLMTKVEDTNVLARHNFETLEYMRQVSQEAIERGGIFTKEGKAYIERLDSKFIANRISPGGCADLLAVTSMSYKLWGYEEAL